MAAERVYTEAQRQAVVATYDPRRVKAPQVVAMAAAGELVGPDGERLEPFEIPEDTVRDLRRRAKDAKQRPSPLLALPATDAIESLRQRLVNVADAEIKAIESLPDGKRDFDKIRQAGKVLEQLSKVSGSSDPRPPSRPSKPAAAGASGQAGALLREHRERSLQPLPPSASVARESEPDRPEVSTEEDPLADLRADIERVREEQRESAEPAWPRQSTMVESRAGRRRRQPDEDVSSITGVW